MLEDAEGINCLQRKMKDGELMNVKVDKVSR